MAEASPMNDETIDNPTQQVAFAVIILWTEFFFGCINIRKVLPYTLACNVTIIYLVFITNILQSSYLILTLTGNI